MRYAQLGSISSGTLRTEDLLPAFAEELDYQLSRQPRRFPRKEYRALIREAHKLLRLGPCAKLWEESAEWVLEALIDALDAFAPPYAFFGASTFLGADFGYWLSDDLLGGNFEGLRVDDTSEVPRGYRGEVLHVNDHGNATLYVANGRGKLTEVWGVV